MDIGSDSIISPACGSNGAAEAISLDNFPQSYALNRLRELGSIFAAIHSGGYPYTVNSDTHNMINTAPDLENFPVNAEAWIRKYYERFSGSSSSGLDIHVKHYFMRHLKYNIQHLTGLLDETRSELAFLTVLKNKLFPDDREAEKRANWVAGKLFHETPDHFSNDVRYYGDAEQEALSIALSNVLKEGESYLGFTKISTLPPYDGWLREINIRGDGSGVFEGTGFPDLNDHFFPGHGERYYTYHSLIATALNLLGEWFGSEVAVEFFTRNGHNGSKLLAASYAVPGAYDRAYFPDINFGSPAIILAMLNTKTLINRYPAYDENTNSSEDDDYEAVFHYFMRVLKEDNVEWKASREAYLRAHNSEAHGSLLAKLIAFLTTALFVADLIQTVGSVLSSVAEGLFVGHFIAEEGEIALADEAGNYC